MDYSLTKADKDKKYTQEERQAIKIRIKELVALINNGIELDNGEKRAADIIDYYSIINLDIDEMFSIASTMSENIRSTLKVFFSRYADLLDNRKRNIEFIMGIKYKFKKREDYPLTEEDEIEVIDNELYIELSEEKKKEIVKFLKENYIPWYYERVYLTALRRYSKGILYNIKEEKAGPVKKMVL